MPSTNVARMTVIPSAVTVVRRRTWNSQHTAMMITVSDTWVLGNELLIALSGRIESMSDEDQLIRQQDGVRLRVRPALRHREQQEPRQAHEVVGGDRQAEHPERRELARAARARSARRARATGNRTKYETE